MSVNHNNITQIIETAEELAKLTKCNIEIEDVAPAYVPAEYLVETLYDDVKVASFIFENGSVINLMLLAF